MLKKLLGMMIAGIITIGMLTGCNTGGGTKEDSTGKSGGGNAEFSLTGGINLDTDHPYYKGMVKFAELMEEKSNGRITMKVYPSAQLGNERDVVEALQMGSVDVTLISAAPLSNFTDDFQVFDFPYIFSGREHAYKVLDSELGKTMLDNLENYDLIGLEFLENGFYWISNNKGIEHPSDMKGVKIRSLENQMQVDAYNQTGANGIAMAFSEVFTALQNGTLDATGLTPSVIGSQKMYTVQNTVTATDHFYAAAPLLMSKKTYDSMPEDLQKVVREAAQEARDYQREESQKYDQAKIDEMKDAGTKIVEVDKSEWEEDMVPAIYDKYVGKGKLIDPEIYQQIKDMDPEAK